MFKQKILVGLLCVSAIMVSLTPVFAQEKKKVSVVGRKYRVLETILPRLGALTFSVPQGSPASRPAVKGMAKTPTLSRISGYNYTLDGQLVGSEDKPGITTDVSKNQLWVHRVTVSGSPVPIQYQIESIDIPTLVDTYKSQADITIREDTVYKGGNIGTKDSPQVVVVEGACLKLTRDFEGYGILILTGERTDNPSWPDESEKDATDIRQRRLKDDLEEIADDLGLAHPQLPRARRRLRLIMEDTATWYGLIISDIGAETTEKVIEDRDISLPTRSRSFKEKGYWIGTKENDLKDLHKMDLHKMGKEKISWWETGKSLFATFSQRHNFAYAATAEELRLRPKRLTGTIYARGGAKGVVLILGRQHDYWHPPYPWPIKKDNLLPDSPKRRWLARRGASSSTPQAGDGVKIYGAILLGGERPRVLMKLADIFYSKEALELVDKRVEKMNFIWEEYKEEAQ